MATGVDLLLLSTYPVRAERGYAVLVARYFSAAAMGREAVRGKKHHGEVKNTHAI